MNKGGVASKDEKHLPGAHYWKISFEHLASVDQHVVSEDG
jgi:hypothetical protein